MTAPTGSEVEEKTVVVHNADSAPENKAPVFVANNLLWLAWRYKGGDVHGWFQYFLDLT